jgi:hypothetical protein
MMFRRGKSVDTHIPEHPVVTVYGMLYALLGECLTVSFWDVWRSVGSKTVVIHDSRYNADFKLQYVYGRQSSVLDVLRTYTIKVSSPLQTYSSDLTTAVGKVKNKITSCESSFLILGQLPYGGGLQLIRGVGSKCVYDGYRLPDIVKINSLANELEVEKVVVRDYDEEMYVLGLDKLFLTFIYWRSLVTPPKPEFTEVRVGEYESTVQVRKDTVS